ncbi:MAG TPA: transposase [Armatimonadota bacterium]|nr:transposase [Armatimonadota bacterium]
MSRVPPLDRCERQLVRDEVLRWHNRAWTVHAVSVMPDHVHILATPLEASEGEWSALPEIMQRVKGRSAYSINKLRRRQGSLWLIESYDPIIRSGRDFDEKFGYMQNNAGVKGLTGPLDEYDGFWCEGMEAIPEEKKATPHCPLRPRLLKPPPRNLPLGKRILPGALVKTRRRLPHWQVAGSTYFIEFGLR